MKLYLCLAVLLTIAAISIGYEMKKMRKSGGRSSPMGFITIEMDKDGDSGSGWGSSGGSGWNSGWKEQPKMQLSIKMNKKLDLGPMLAMLGSMSQSGWDDSSSEEDYSSGGSSGWGNSGGGYSSGGSGGYSGGSSGSGWGSGGNNGYDGMSGYSSNVKYNKRRY